MLFYIYSTRMILCYRLGKWIQLKTDELLPGDIVSLASNTVKGLEMFFQLYDLTKNVIETSVILSIQSVAYNTVCIYWVQIKILIRF